MSEYDQEHEYSRAPDLEELAKTALTRRQLAWKLLKQTRNPTYVAMRYGYEIDTMEKALAKIPEEESVYQKLKRRADSAPPILDRGKPDAARGAEKKLGDLLPDTSPGREPGSDDDRDEL